MNDLIFNTNAQFDDVSYDPNSNDWILTFSDSISVLISGFWRLLSNDHITLVSLDHMHTFGLPGPVDLCGELRNVLKSKKLLQVHVAKGTGDLKLTFTEEIEMEIFTSSTGYESYQFSISNKSYIGLGGGEIAIFSV